ncbi:MAG TPA: DUF4190 domain-containing protein [Ilumatobacteraceae bacterium]|nr:DUF4190 domain-containing protein [Ilumatobacteraceae bacterium]
MSSPPFPPSMPPGPPTGSGPGGFQPAPGYGSPPGYQPYGFQPSGQQPSTSGMAIASLVCSLVGVVVCGIPAVLGVIFGFIGLSQTKGGARNGRGMAIAGVVVGIAVVLLWGALFVAIAVDPDHCIEFGRSNNCP